MTQKLVIKQSSFDGVDGFILGRRHYNAQFYLLNNSYSARMADTPIFRKTYEDASRNRPDNWGDRYYFSGSEKEGAAYEWLNDNIEFDAADMTPTLVFNGKWDPEDQLVKIKAQIAIHETGDILPQR